MSMQDSSLGIKKYKTKISQLAFKGHEDSGKFHYARVKCDSVK